MHPTSSVFLAGSFIVLTAAVALGVVAAIWRVRPAWGPRAAAAMASWLALTAGAALSGRLAQFDARPPPFGLMLVATFAVAAAVGLSRVGAALSTMPLCVLVGAQGFRLPLELLMHRAATEGVMPNVMSYDGRNVDIAAGGLAIVVGVALKLGASRRWAVAWVVLAFGTLINVVAVAVLASPLVRLWGEAELNTWVGFFPFVWLPTVMVATALAGQIVVVRALLRSPPPKSVPAG